jgi:transmembrane sensor
LEDQSLQQTLQKYVENKATPEEVRWLLAHFHTESEDELMKLVMKGFDLDQQDVPESNPDQAALDRVYNRLHENLGFTENKNGAIGFRRFRVMASVAAVLAGLAIGGYFILRQPVHVQQTVQNQHNDIAPGSNKAILTLANGQKIVLTGAKNGQIATQGQTVIQKTANGQVVYEPASLTPNTAITYNTISTPRGGQHWVTLSDGTKVLLNAASSLTYPVAFNGKERKVTLTGEAYFEVVHNDKQPFLVETKNETVQDIGTHFNINAYADEPVVRTTLLEGSIRVAHGAQAEILKPGQESVLKADELKVNDVDTEEAIAWKNGYFMFDSENIQPIMRMIARWYDVEVIYTGDIPTDKFGGSVSRFGNVSQVLDKLALTGRVHFKIEGRRIMVSN